MWNYETREAGAAAAAAAAAGVVVVAAIGGTGATAATAAAAAAGGGSSSSFQLQDVQQQIAMQQRWGGDLELASPPPYFLHEGLMDAVPVQVWRSDLELASPGGFDSCIMDSSWTSSKDHNSNHNPAAAAAAAASGPGLDSAPSPTSSAVSIRNLGSQQQQQQHQQQGSFRLNDQQQALLQQQVDLAVDVSSSSSVSSLLNRASISGGGGGNSNSNSSKNLAAESSWHSDFFHQQQQQQPQQQQQQQQQHQQQRSRSCGGDESVGSPSGGSIGFMASRRERSTSKSKRGLDDGEGGEGGGGNAWEDLADTGKRCRIDGSQQPRGPTERMMEIKLEDLSRYFTMPITQASKELKVGLTVLKKRCREFGIPRWPHRKLKSLESLIHKSQELAKDSEGKAPNPVIHAVQELEKQKKLMEESPGLELDDRTKRFRQAIFKASYKQRRRAVSKDSQASIDSTEDCSTLPYCSTTDQQQQQQHHQQQQ